MRRKMHDRDTWCPNCKASLPMTEFQGQEYVHCPYCNHQVRNFDNEVSTEGGEDDDDNASGKNTAIALAQVISFLVIAGIGLAVYLNSRAQDHQPPPPDPQMQALQYQKSKIDAERQLLEQRKRVLQRQLEAARQKEALQRDAVQYAAETAAGNTDKQTSTSTPVSAGGEVMEPEAAVEAGAEATVGILCVAPLDTSSTPEKGSMTVDQAHKSWGAPRSVRKSVLIQVDDVTETVTAGKGAQFPGLSLTEKHLIVMTANGAKRPFFRKEVDFRTTAENKLCVYDNAFYNTVQISEQPRRRFCRKCFKE